MNFLCKCLVLCLAITTAQAAEPQIVTDVREAADWMANSLPSWGYRGDFSVESLKDIDRFVDEQFPNGKPKPGGSFANQLGAGIFALGAYVGETIRRQGDGQWLASNRDPDDVINLTVKLKSGSIFWPMQRVMLRLLHGRSDGIYVYGAVILKLLPNSTDNSP